AVQDLAYDELKTRLLADGQVLEMDDPYAISSRKLKGTVVDDRAASFVGQWQQSAANKPFVDGGYQHNGNTDRGQKSAVFETQLKPGSYEVRLSYPPNSNRAKNVPVTVIHTTGTKTIIVNQQEKPPINGVFVSLGRFSFSDVARVEISTADTNGYVIVDAVQFLPVRD
ncbi:MAG: FAD-dependent oxidoreductase, partial [Fuerstiella sp.]